jgi:hypothetical protein
VDQTHTHFGKGFRQHGRGFLRRLRSQLLGLFDQRTDPVRLAAGTAGLHDPCDNLITTLLRHHDSLDRCATRRKLVDHGNVEVRIGSHGERSRYRRGRHDELVGESTVLLSLLLQAQSLLDAEAVLLVDDDE